MNHPQAPTKRALLNKVPAVTLAFWVIKIMATTVGETGADYLNVNLGFGLPLTSLVMAALLLSALVLQLRSQRCEPWIYWLNVVLVSVVGTLITDNLSDNLGVPLWSSTTAFGIALILTFAAWYASERTLSIRSIVGLRRELFYWVAVLFTFALGTAAGDLLAETLQLGYLNSALVFGAAIALVALAQRMFGLNSIAAFWAAYVLTRPFGASCGDWLSQGADQGGLGLGATLTSVAFLMVITSLMVLMTLRSRENRPSWPVREGAGTAR